MEWTDERVSRLKSLFADGYSATQIAADIGGGLTRNAVIGKTMRLGLSRGGIRARIVATRILRRPRAIVVSMPGPEAEAIKQPVRTHALVKRKPPKPQQFDDDPDDIEARDLPAEEFTNGGVIFDDLKEHHCRYPKGDTTDFAAMRFCGDNKLDIGPYCQRHHDVTHSGGSVPRKVSPETMRQRQRARIAAGLRAYN